MSSTIQFSEKGHHYKIVPIEGSDGYSVIKDNRFTRRAGNGIIHQLYSEEGDVIGDIINKDEIVALFGKEVRHG